MQIQINEDYRIRAEPQQWILEQRSVPKKETSAERWKPIGYFASMAVLLKRLTDMQVRQIEGEYPAGALEHLCGALSDIKRDIDGVLDTLSVDLSEKWGRDRG